jgi:hypothetical protein
MGGVPDSAAPRIHKAKSKNHSPPVIMGNKPAEKQDTRARERGDSPVYTQIM